MTTIGKLPNLLDRDFFVGFFLPAFALLSAIWIVLDAFLRLPEWMNLASSDAFFESALVIGITWLAALTLMALNRQIIRTMEGYTFKNILGFRWLTKLKKFRFLKRTEPLLEKQRQIDAAQAMGQTGPDLEDDFSIRLEYAVARYPDAQRWLLPTDFGNRYRAIEVYSRVVYGLDAIPAWPRLEAILPPEFKKNIAEAEALLNFSTNLFLAACIGVVLYIYFAVTMACLPSIYLPIIGLLVAIIGYVSALGSLLKYGEHIMSAFDLYRGDLADQLGLNLPRSASAEREMWGEVSRMMIYRSAQSRDRLTKFQKPGGTEI